MIENRTITTQPRANGLMERSIDLSFDFGTLILDDPSILDDIPNGVTLVLIPDDDAELAAIKITRGIEAIHRGEDVYTSATSTARGRTTPRTPPSRRWHGVGTRTVPSGIRP